MNEKLKPELGGLTSHKGNSEYNLILHNDEVNTFDFVIESLVEVCHHEIYQAEQCAFITHYKGKCDVKKGSMEELSKMRNRLSNKGLSVSIN